MLGNFCVWRGCNQLCLRKDCGMSQGLPLERKLSCSAFCCPCNLMTSSSWLHQLLRLQPVISVWEHMSRAVFLGMEEGAVGIEYSWVDCLCLAPLHCWSFCLAISLSRRLVCSDAEVEKGDRRGLHWIWPQNCHCILFQLWLSFFILKADRVYSLDLCEMGAKECWHFFLCACLIHPCP